jgi:hypothetical protein
MNSNNPGCLLLEGLQLMAPLSRRLSKRTYEDIHDANHAQQKLG